MDEPAELAPEDAAQRAARWAASLPPPPFVDASAGDHRRFTPLSPRVAVLLVAGMFLAVLLLIAQDSVRPFIVGLLFVYLLDPPVRWLARHGLRRSIAILVVYAGTIVIVTELLLLTVAPLINELLRFIADFPTLAADLDKQVQRLSELYARLDIPPAIRDWIDGILAGIGQPGGAVSIDLSFLLPVLTGAGSLIGILFGYLILPVWVAYLLNDRVALVAQFDRALPDELAVRRVGRDPDGRARLRPVGARPADPRASRSRSSRSSGCSWPARWSTRSSAATRSCCRSSPACSS